MKNVNIDHRLPLTIQGILRERVRIAADQITILRLEGVAENLWSGWLKQRRGARTTLQTIGLARHIIKCWKPILPLEHHW